MPPKLKSEATEWKSRFPVARIKKIMQADDDVGKVAQVVPVILSKALELFMQNLVQAAAQQAINTGHKRVLPGHLKLAVKADSKFDFLEDQVEKLPEVSQAPVQQGSAGNAGPGGSSEGRRPRQRSTNPARGRPQSQQQQTVSSPLPGMAEASTGMPAPAHASQTGAYMPDFARTSGSSQADAQARPAMPSPMETQAQAQGQEPPLKRSRVSDLLSPSD